MALMVVIMKVAHRPQTFMFSACRDTNQLPGSVPVSRNRRWHDVPQRFYTIPKRKIPIRRTLEASIATQSRWVMKAEPSNCRIASDVESNHVCRNRGDRRALNGGTSGLQHPI